MVIDYPEVQKVVEDENTEVQIVDMRGKTEYDNGHIPRAINVPAAKLQNKDNTYKTLSERK